VIPQRDFGPTLKHGAEKSASAEPVARKKASGTRPILRGSKHART
jgi:hypothetical protein